MPIEAVGHRVLLKIARTVEKRDELLEKEAATLKAAGFEIKSDKWSEDAEEFASQEGIVYSIGPTAWSIAAYGGKPWVNRGDRVMIGKFTGKIVVDPDTEEKYMVVNDEDILARLT